MVTGPEIGTLVAVDPGRVSRPQGYLLDVGRERISIVGHDAAGAFYGAMTLRQIARRAHGGVLPCARIADHPDVAHRGVMLDVSRDRVPTMAALYELVDQLAEWKVNQLQLYTEHTFAYRNHPEVWAGWSPMTAFAAVGVEIDHLPAGPGGLADSTGRFEGLLAAYRGDLPAPIGTSARA